MNKPVVEQPISLKYTSTGENVRSIYLPLDCELQDIQPPGQPGDSLARPVEINAPGTVVYSAREGFRKPDLYLGLDFDSKFECGNLDKVVFNPGSGSYDLYLKPDEGMSLSCKWFMFRVQNTRTQSYRFTIKNLHCESGLSNYSHGQRPAMLSQGQHTHRHTGWHRIGTDVAFQVISDIPIGESKCCVCSLSFTFKSEYSNDTLYIAANPPYTYTHLQNMIQTLATSRDSMRHVRVRELCRTHAGNRCDLMVITDDSQQWVSFDEENGATSIFSESGDASGGGGNDGATGRPKRWTSTYEKHKKALEEKQLFGDEDKNDDKNDKEDSHSSKYADSGVATPEHRENVPDSGVASSSIVGPATRLSFARQSEIQPNNSKVLDRLQRSMDSMMEKRREEEKERQRQAFEAEPHDCKPVVVVMGRSHPGEPESSFVCEGLLRFLLLENNEFARSIRSKFVFMVVPMMNPDGVIQGHSRTNALHQDLNRCWVQPSEQLHPTVYHVKRLLRTLRQQNRLAGVIDLHSHSSVKGMAVFGSTVDAGSVGFVVPEPRHPKFRNRKLLTFDSETAAAPSSENVIQALGKRSRMTNLAACSLKDYEDATIANRLTANAVVAHDLNIPVAVSIQASSFCGHCAPYESRYFVSADYIRFGRALALATVEVLGLRLAFIRKPVHPNTIDEEHSEENATVRNAPTLRTGLRELLSYDSDNEVEASDTKDDTDVVDGKAIIGGSMLNDQNTYLGIWEDQEACSDGDGEASNSFNSLRKKYACSLETSRRFSNPSASNIVSKGRNLVAAPSVQAVPVVDVTIRQNKLLRKDQRPSQPMFTEPMQAVAEVALEISNAGTERNPPPNKPPEEKISLRFPVPAQNGGLPGNALGQQKGSVTITVPKAVISSMDFNIMGVPSSFGETKEPLSVGPSKPDMPPDPWNQRSVEKVNQQKGDRMELDDAVFMSASITSQIPVPAPLPPDADPSVTKFLEASEYDSLQQWRDTSTHGEVSDGPSMLNQDAAFPILELFENECNRVPEQSTMDNCHTENGDSTAPVSARRKRVYRPIKGTASSHREYLLNENRKKMSSLESRQQAGDPRVVMDRVSILAENCLGVMGYMSGEDQDVGAAMDPMKLSAMPKYARPTSSSQSRRQTRGSRNGDISGHRCLTTSSRKHRGTQEELRAVQSLERYIRSLSRDGRSNRGQQQHRVVHSPLQCEDTLNGTSIETGPQLVVHEVSVSEESAFLRGLLLNQLRAISQPSNSNAVGGNYAEGLEASGAVPETSCLPTTISVTVQKSRSLSSDGEKDIFPNLDSQEPLPQSHLLQEPLIKFPSMASKSAQGKSPIHSIKPVELRFKSFASLGSADFDVNKSAASSVVRAELHGRDSDFLQLRPVSASTSTTTNVSPTAPRPSERPRSKRLDRVVERSSPVTSPEHTEVTSDIREHPSLTLSPPKPPTQPRPSGFSTKQQLSVRNLY